MLPETLIVEKGQMQKLWITLIAAIFITSTGSFASQSAKTIVGVNIVSVRGMSEAQQNDFIEQLHSNGVNTIRLGLNEEQLPFIVRAYKRGICSVVMFHAQCGDAHLSPVDVAVGRRWPVWSLSDIDLQKSKAWFCSHLEAFDKAGVKLTAIELDNEINSARFNGDFAIHGSSRILSLPDLYNKDDVEAKPIAAGLRAYVKAMVVLKEARDQSTVNKTTPIISAGLADWGLPQPKSPSNHLELSLPDTLFFFYQHGMDNLVDGYGVHVYPSGNSKKTVEDRINDLQKTTFAAGRKITKPFWLTEWGFSNHDFSCPVDDESRRHIVAVERAAFEKFVKEGRLAAICYYAWWGGPGVQEEPYSVFRCGSLTSAGKAALSPLW